MTTDNLPAVPQYTVSGPGPYAVGHEYTDGSLLVTMVLNGVATVLAASDYSVTPLSGDSGVVTLTGAIATTYDTATMLIDRNTDVEQGWISGGADREDALEAQLDRTVQGQQDLKRHLGRVLQLPIEATGISPVITELPPRTLALSDPDLPFANEMPGDALVLRHVYGDGVNWRLDGDRIIHSDIDGNLTIRYTCRDVREKYLPGLFRTALALQLAVLLSARWVTTRAKRNDLKADLADAIAIAKRMDAHSASAMRSDGRPDQADWASEVVR